MMNFAMHVEVILAAAVTGGLIGFFWHPAGAVVALAMGAFLALGARDGGRPEARP
ncbi:MAG: hypothetical protein ACREM3_31010 [Candidatus Rokuibacteriota bacterium]